MCPAISIIIPIYKVEKYIDRCLASVQAQSFSDFEVLMVDDGSPDRSAEIAEKYTADSRFKLLRQENKGPGIARNAALAQAQGEYVAFVDSDDAVTADYLEKLYAAAKETKADAVMCGYMLCDKEGGRLHRKKLTKRAGIYTGETIMKGLLRDITVKCFLWNKLWKRSLFTDNGILFPTGLFEDNLTVSMLVYYARRIAVIKDSVYIYTRRGDSITGMTDRNCVGDCLTARLEVRKLLLSSPEASIYKFSLLFQRIMTLFVTSSWIITGAVRTRSTDRMGENFRKVLRFSLR